MPTAAPPIRSALGALPPLNGEDMVVLTVLPLQGEVASAASRRGPPAEETACGLRGPGETARGLGQPRPSRSERERQRTKRRIWHQPIDSSSPEPIDAQTRQLARDQTPALELCEPSPVGTGPAQGTQGDVRSSPPAGGARGGRSSPRKPGGVWGSKAPGAKRTGGAAVVAPKEQSPADARAVSPEPTSTEDTVFCRWNVRLVRVGDP